MQISRLSTLAIGASISLCNSLAIAATGDLRIQVLDRDGAPVPEVAVYAQRVDSGGADTAGATSALAGNSGRAASPAGATMNQSELAFSPHILVIETGTAVEFPNEDAVRHHVYSFSPAKHFDLTIDSASIHSERLVFDTAGVVTLGCNIHDNMLAYVLVVDTPHYAKTNADGIAVLQSVGDGRIEVNLWTPRLTAGRLPDAEVVVLEAEDSVDLTFQFDEKLYPAHEHSETSLHWSHY